MAAIHRRTTPRQNTGHRRPVRGQARACRPKLRVERRPFLASKAVIFGLNFTDLHILVVIHTCRVETGPKEFKLLWRHQKETLIKNIEEEIRRVPSPMK